MCYINNDFFFSSLICITFYRRKRNTLPISKSVLISKRACTKLYTKSMWSRTSLQYTSSYTEWMQKNALNCMRKQKTCNSCRVREWAIVKVARLCWLFVNAFCYCLARTILVRTRCGPKIMSYWKGYGCPISFIPLHFVHVYKIIHGLRVSKISNRMSKRHRSENPSG